MEQLDMTITATPEEWKRLFAAAEAWIIFDKTTRESVAPGTYTPYQAAKEAGARIAPHLVKLADTFSSIPKELW